MKVSKNPGVLKMEWSTDNICYTHDLVISSIDTPLSKYSFYYHIYQRMFTWVKEDYKSRCRFRGNLILSIHFGIPGQY